MSWTEASAAPIGMIDSHAQAFTADCVLVAGRRHSPEREAPLPVLLNLLDECQVAAAVLVQPSFLGQDNGYLTAALQAVPDRLRGIASILPSIKDAELQALTDIGVVGLRIDLRDDAPRKLEEDAWRSLLRRTRRQGWLLELDAEGQVLESAIAALKFFDGPIVIENMGRPDRGSGLQCPGLRRVLREGPEGRIWVKLVPPAQIMANVSTIVRAYLDHLGPGRLLWGSRWPWVGQDEPPTYATAVRWLTALVPDQRTRREILVDTPSRLFGIRATETPPASTSLERLIDKELADNAMEPAPRRQARGG